MPHYAITRLAFDAFNIAGWGSTAWNISKGIALLQDARWLKRQNKLPAIPTRLSDQTVQTTVSNTPRKLIYGRTRVAGNIVFMEVSDNPSTTDKSWLKLSISSR